MKPFVPNVRRENALRFSGLRTSPSTPAEDQLARINQFTRRPFSAEEVYVGQLWLANNAIDRDGERYNEEILQRFDQNNPERPFCRSSCYPPDSRQRPLKLAYFTTDK